MTSTHGVMTCLHPQQQQQQCEIGWVNAERNSRRVETAAGGSGTCWRYGNAAAFGGSSLVDDHFPQPHHTSLTPAKFSCCCWRALTIKTTCFRLLVMFRLTVVVRPAALQPLILLQLQASVMSIGRRRSHPPTKRRTRRQ